MISPAEPALSAQTAWMLWHDEQETMWAAHHLAKQPLLENVFIELRGGLGSGKTTFSRYLLQALGITGRIKSPTYAVVESYEARSFPVWHFDFYRFNDPQEWEDAGFRDIFATDGLKLAEWPEQAEGLLPQADLKLLITPDMNNNERRVDIQAMTEAGQSILAGWLRAIQNDPMNLKNIPENKNKP